MYCKNEWYIPKLWVGREYFIVVPDLINYPEYRTALVFKTQTTFALNALLRTEIYFAKLIWFVHWNCLSPNNNKVCKKEKQDWVQFCWFSFSTLKMFSVQTSFLFWLSLWFRYFCVFLRSQEVEICEITKNGPFSKLCFLSPLECIGLLEF